MTTASEMTPPNLQLRPNKTLILLDGIGSLLVAATIVAVAVMLASYVVPPAGVVVLGVWTSAVALGAMPALAVLYFSPPRRPLKERSALFASTSWFFRSVWAGLIFALSIVLGASAGVVAAEISEQAKDSDQVANLTLVIQSLGSLILWPALLGIVGVTYLIMGIRWWIDLGSIISENQGTTVRTLIEERWSIQVGRSATGRKLADVLLEFSLGGASRVAMALTLVTLLAVVVAFFTNLP